VSATAVIAAIGNVTQFTNGRQLVAWLGLVPKAHSTAGKPWLLGVSTRGNIYLRKWFVHGARPTFHRIDTKEDERS
jgi:transposase